MALRNLRRDDYDLAIRYSSKAAAGSGATQLFGEKLVPLCSPNLVSGRPLRQPQDLQHFFLIHFNDLEGNAPWLTWETWFTGVRAKIVEGKGALYFSHYDQAMRATLAGQGIVLGRLPVVDDLLHDGRLIAPLGMKLAVSLEDQSYWLMLAEHRREKREVRAFAAWLLENAIATDSRRSQSRRGVSSP
jgi:DNA-binding transcriptional LysR family regulator